MSDTICKGDIVQLASGDGEEMTVSEIGETGEVSVELGGERGPATFQLDELQFVRRYSVPVGNAVAIDKEA